jgi:hypothetical protein
MTYDPGSGLPLPPQPLVRTETPQNWTGTMLQPTLLPRGNG